MAKARTKASRLLRLRAAAPIAVALGLGALGGAGFAALNLPLPWMLGALAITTAASVGGLELRVPELLRRPMIAVLGAMLGTTFTPERLDGALSWLPSLARAAAVRGPGRRPDLSLPAALLRFRSDQRLLRRLARRPQRDDRAVRPARRRPAPRVAGARRASPVHRVDDTVHRPGVRLPAARHGRAA